jgi:hypothetical protein
MAPERDKEEDTGTDTSPELAELHQACRRIQTLALEMDETEAGTMSKLRFEMLIDREIVIVHRHLFRLAHAILLDATRAIYCGSSRSADIDDEALDAIVPLFEKRKSTGLREVVHAISLLFERNPHADPHDTLHWLCGAVKRAVGAARKEALRQQNPIYFSICRRTRYSVDRSERFRIDEGIVYDESADARETSTLRFAEVEDLMKLCASVLPLPFSVAGVVTTVFDCLSDGNREFRAALPLRTLQTAVYRILEPVLVEQYAFKRPPLPDETCLMQETDHAALETAREITQEYKWRKDFDEETRAAIREAAFDYIWDELHLEKKQSQFEYLSAYLPGCTRDAFESEYKGSLQNFIRTFKERLRKKLHADD